METKEISITPPEGWEVDEQKSTFTKIVYKRINEIKKLPTRWDDIGKIDGFYVDDNCEIYDAHAVYSCFGNRNVFATDEQAVASIALAQLSQLKKVYNDGLESGGVRFVIEFYNNRLITSTLENRNAFLAFKTRELRDEFLRNFEDLILKAKPLLG